LCKNNRFKVKRFRVHRSRFEGSRLKPVVSGARCQVSGNKAWAWGKGLKIQGLSSYNSLIPNPFFPGILFSDS
jgi:hypothetical protein